MGGVFYIPLGGWQVWRLTFSTTTQANILTDENPQGFLTINDLEMAAYITHIHFLAPRMAPLEHITKGF